MFIAVIFFLPQITVHVYVTYVTKDSRQKEILTSTRREFTWEFLNTHVSSVNGPFVMWVFIMLSTCTPSLFFFRFWDALYMGLFPRTFLIFCDVKKRSSKYFHCTLSLTGFKIYLLVSMYNSSLYIGEGCYWCFITFSLILLSCYLHCVHAFLSSGNWYFLKKKTAQETITLLD